MAKSRSKRGSKMNATGRTTTDRFIMLAHYMLRSPAWKTLSPNAKALLIEVWARYNGANNGAISYAVREAEDIGLSKDQASRAFKELIKRGFLKMHRASTFSLKTKEARTWELTAVPNGESAPSKDFMRWTESVTRSHQRDGQSHQCDSKPANETILLTSVAPARPTEPDLQSPQSHQRDTYNIPGMVRVIDVATDAVSSNAMSAPAVLLDMAEPSLLDYYDAVTGKSAPAISPVDQLRLDLDAHMARAPKGEIKRIAERLGLSRPQISNFKAGRFGLNHSAAAMLRQYLSETAA